MHKISNGQLAVGSGAIIGGAAMILGSMFWGAFFIAIGLLYLLWCAFPIPIYREKLVDIDIFRRVIPANVRHGFWFTAQPNETQIFFMAVKNIGRKPLRGVKLVMVHNTNVGQTGPLAFKVPDSSLDNSVDIHPGNIGTFGLVYDLPNTPAEATRAIPPVESELCGMCTGKDRTLNRSRSEEFIRLEIHCVCDDVESVLAKEFVKISSEGRVIQVEHLKDWTY